MNLFKERLKQAIESVLFVAVVVGICWLFIWLLTTFFGWLFGTFIVLMLLFITGYFVNWLFIEPFRKRK